MPNGYICGFPTQNGDLYGGSMYTKSLDTSTQGQAIACAEAQWSCSGAAVCKYKYQPFKDGSEKRYGCRIHHGVRLKRIEAHGPRPGWVDFGVWHSSKSKH